MRNSLSVLEIKVLEKMYLREIKVLKFKLLNGAFWKDVKKQKNKAMKLAAAINEKQGHQVKQPYGNVSLEE